jgi:two-component system, sensor histidine kinase PdtaS
MIEGAYSHADLELLEGMVLQMAAAARNAALYENAQREVAERAKAQVAIEELNRRLQRAMAETHHRVKNNLQVLAALVDVQLSDGEGSISRAALQRLSLQIRSLSSLHDLLTQSAKVAGEADSVPVRVALENLIGIIRTTAIDRTIQLEAEDLDLPVRQCTSFALLVNELVSNAIKHGQGVISVRLTTSQVEAGRVDGSKGLEIELSVEDEGPGFGRDFDPRADANTGLELIDTLGRWDLEGSLRFENRLSGGARVVVSFPQASR